MNYMVIGPCAITFLLIANSLLVFFAKNILYISILLTMLCSLRVRGWKRGLVFFNKNQI